MKKFFLLLLFSITGFIALAQEPILKLRSDSTKVNVNGTVIMKNDEFYVDVMLNGNNNTTSRALYFDFEYQNTAFDLISITHTGTGGNGGVLPAGATITLNTYQYPGYSWISNQNNITANGNTNYQYQNYNYTSGGPKTIIRSYLSWASPNGFPFNNYDQLLKLRFKLKSTAVGDTWDPIKMNFAASFNANGSSGAAVNEVPKTSVITLNPDATKLVKAKIDLNGNNITKPYDGRWRSIDFDASDYVLGDKSIYSTPYDMYLFSKALYENKLINSESQALAYTAYSKERKINNYGFGWRIKNFKDSLKKEVYHNGWWHGYRSSFHRRLRDTLTVVIFSNQLNYSAYHTNKVYEIIDNEIITDTVEELE
jgi:hypothetical protein